MAQPLALELYGVPLSHAHTFLHFDLRPQQPKRAHSAPACCEGDATPTANRRKKKKKKRNDRYDSTDDAALREGRAQTINELWRHMSDTLVEKVRKAIADDLDMRRPRRRTVLSENVLSLVAQTLGRTGTDLVTMFVHRLLRTVDSGRAAEFWCSDRQLMNVGLQAFLREAEQTRLLCASAVIIQVPSRRSVFPIYYSESMRVDTLRALVRRLSRLGEGRLRVQRASGSDVVENTLKEAGVKAGDILRASLV